MRCTYDLNVITIKTLRKFNILIVMKRLMKIVRTKGLNIFITYSGEGEKERTIVKFL